VSLVNIGLWLLGIALVAVGYREGRGPWARYQALKEQDANAERYSAWRGGARDTGTTGASVAMELLRRRARRGAAIVVAGFILIFLGFLLK
jgi:uncharacterized membrane protein